jgi:hypothetical protein
MRGMGTAAEKMQQVFQQWGNTPNTGIAKNEL